MRERGASFNGETCEVETLSFPLYIHNNLHNSLQTWPMERLAQWKRKEQHSFVDCSWALLSWR